MSAGCGILLCGEEDVVLHVPVKVLIGLVGLMVGRLISEAVFLV